MAIFTGLGRLGRDAEVRYTQGDNTPVATLSLAFNYGRKGPEGKKPTQWVEAALWGKLAEALAEYLPKGQLVNAVLEDLHIEEFDRSNGQRGSKLVGRVLSIELAGGRPDTTPAPPPPSRPPPKTSAGFDDMDDDIPF